MIFKILLTYISESGWPELIIARTFKIRIEIKY